MTGERTGGQPPSKAARGVPVQIAYAVTDVDEAAHRFAAAYGAGPFFVRRHIAVPTAVHRGSPTVFDHSSAYGQWGAVMVELVQQHDDSPSPIRDVYRHGDEGLHHVACFCDDLDAELARQAALGHPVAMVASTGTTRFAFVDAWADLGHFIELYEATDRMLAFYAHVRSAADEWDGSKPLRTL